MNNEAVLALEDGSLFFGKSIGACCDVGGEVVFNTSITGYQEILTDPSYAKQMVALTYPHIGNTGINSIDIESLNIYASALIIKNESIIPSSWSSEQTLGSYLQKNGIPAIANIDTRRLTRIIRNKGAMRGWICTKPDSNKEELVANALEQVKTVNKLTNLDLASKVSTQKSYNWQQSIWDDTSNSYPKIAQKQLQHHVVVYDFGVKKNILRMLVARGCYLTVVPATTTAEEVLALKPKGVLLSNGPGDPEPCDYAITAIKQLLKNKVPMLGICLGHQLLAIAKGAKTEKMKFGHHGANHPVQDLATKKVFISSQNHGFAVKAETLPKDVKVTHTSLFDGSLQGIECMNSRAIGFQGHPEASPGPQELDTVFDKFITFLTFK